jgi:glycosyltransferase involved in cell wall biosynthesis
MLSLLTLFKSQGFEVTFASPAIKSEHRTDLLELGIAEYSIALNCSSFDEFVTSIAPDLVLFDRFMLEEQFGWRVAKHCPNALRVLDTEDLHFLRESRHTAIKHNIPFEDADLHTELAKREIAAILRSDITLIISEFEFQLLVQKFSVPADILLHCPFMLEPLQASNLSYAQRQHFISIGNFRHQPNWDAVLQLKQTLWPQIRKHCKDAELHIYGAYPPPKATQMHNPAQGFLVKGWTKDAKKVMQTARVLLAPLRFGAGLKGKLIEAALCNTPSVTTKIGSEGMADAENWPGYVASSDNDFIANAVSLYNQQESWQQASEKSQEMLKATFDRPKIQTQLIEKIQHTSTHLKQHRRSNFIGSMLLHHSMKSTQYMAQWIEAKNKLTVPDQ